MSLHDRNLSFRIGLAVAWAVLLLGACSRSDSPETGGQQAASVPDDPLADAPQEWEAFLDWAEAQFQRTPPSVPLPVEPRLPEVRWPIVRLDELLGDADVTCVWQPAPSPSAALATLGPFRSDRQRDNLRLEYEKDRKLGKSLVLAISGFEVRREEVGRIFIETRVPFGKHLDLIWSGAGRIRVPLPDNQNFWPLSIATDGLVDWSGPLKQILLRTDGVGFGVVEVRALRFMPRQDAFPKPVGVRRVRLEREIRPAIYTHCPATLKLANVRLPERAKLQVGLGHVPAGLRRQAGASDDPGGGRAASARATEFEVIIEHDSRQTPVLKRRLGPDEGWTDVSVGLEAWGGRSVSVILQTISGTFGSIALWANPVIYEPVDDPPCVILYLIDALGAKHLDLYGYERPTGPKIAALAAEGVWFSRAFCNSPVTVASVPDTQFSLPTERHGVYASSIPAPLELVSLADALRAAGFATALVSTNVNVGPRQNTDQGFDHFIDRIALAEEDVSGRTVPLEELRHWLEVHRDRPMYIYIHTAEPHAPYLPPKNFAGRFDPDYTGLIDGGMGAGGFRAARSERDIAHVRALYDEEVLYADTRFGLFLDLLNEQRLRDRANVVVTADHGEQLMEHGRWGHGSSLHTEVLHIPLVAAGPLVTARGRVDVPAQLHDIMPTILEMFGLPEPYPLAGQSLLPFMQLGLETDTDAFEQRVIFHSHHRYAGLNVVQYAVIEAARWKLMYFYEKDPARPNRKPTHFALYDLQDFFYDRENVIDAHRDVARRLIGELIAYRQRQQPYTADRSAKPLELDPAQIRALQALGYVGGDEDNDEDE